MKVGFVQIPNNERYFINNKGIVYDAKKDTYKTYKVNSINAYPSIVSEGNCYLLHRIVATLFVPNPYNLPYVNHKDEDTNNAHYENLEWCTRRYNQYYSILRRRKTVCQNPKAITMDILLNWRRRFKNNPNKSLIDKMSHSCRISYEKAFNILFFVKEWQNTEYCEVFNPELHSKNMTLKNTTELRHGTAYYNGISEFDLPEIAKVREKVGTGEAHVKA